MVIAIISILAGLLLPALVKTREMALRAVCISNVRQYGIASVLYAQDNKDIISFGYNDATYYYYWTWFDFLIVNHYLEHPYTFSPRSGGREKVDYTFQKTHRQWACPKTSYVGDGGASAWKYVYYGPTPGYSGQIHKVKRPTQLAMFGDGLYNEPRWTEQYRTRRHSRGEVYAYYDNHVKWWNEIIIDLYFNPYTSDYLPWRNGTTYANGQTAIP